MPLVINLLEDVSAVGTSPTLIILGLLILLYFIYRKDKLRVLNIFLSYGSGIYSTILKGLFTEPRPLTYHPSGIIPWDQILVWGRYSFPSSHTVVYTVIFGYLYYLTFMLHSLDKVLRHTIRLLSFIIVVLVGASRLILGAHFVKDVLAGYAFGFIYLMLLIKLERFLEQRQLHKRLKHTKR